MKKTLRLLLTLLLVAVGTAGFAQTTVTFTAGTDQTGASYTGSGNPSSGEETVTKEGISIATSNGAFKASQYRVYKGSTFTVTSTVGNITSVVITCTANGTTKQGPGCFDNETVTAGSYTYETSGKTGTWTGDASTFTITAKSNQVRMTSIVVTYTPSGSGGTTVTNPTIEGETPFTESTTVTITVPEETTVYYTTDGQDPNDNVGTEYTAPFTITESATVKAIAYKGEETSGIVSKEFVKSSVYENIAALQAAGTTANATAKSSAISGVLKLTNAQVTLINGNNHYLQDATGGIDVYMSSGFSYKAGQILNGYVTVTYYKYNGLPEVIAFTANGEGITATEGTATPTVMTIADTKKAENLCKYIKVEGVTVTAGTSGNATISDGTTTGALYQKGTTFKSGNADVVGIAGIYKNNYQIVEPTLTYNTTPTTLTFDDDSPVILTTDATEGLSFTRVATLSPSVEGATITYSSSNTNLASVDAATGKVTVDDRSLEAGATATITATYAGNEEYGGSTATYVIAVPYTVAQAENVLTAGTQTTDAVAISGIVSQLPTTALTRYNNVRYYISDDGTTTSQLNIFGGTWFGNVKFPNDNAMELGDKVVILGVLTNYTSGETTTPEVSNSYIIKLSTPITIGETGYATAYYSGKNFTIPTGVTATTYKVADGTNTLVGTAHAAGEVIPAGEAVVLSGAAAKYDFNVVASTTTTADADNELLGTDTETALTADATKYFYELSLNANKEAGFVGFYWANDDGSAFTNGAHKAYLTRTKDTTAAKISAYLLNGGTVTGINDINAEEKAYDGAIYNVAGQRVNKDYKGVVIINGKKIIKK